VTLARRDDIGNDSLSCSNMMLMLLGCCSELLHKICILSLAVVKKSVMVDDDDEEDFGAFFECMYLCLMRQQLQH
jgi:hypothetical protein